MDYLEIIERAEINVREYLKEHQDLNLLFHELGHTESVVTAVKKIAHHYELSKKEHFICVIAAWFHDIGYSENPADHERLGATRAEAFLLENHVDEDTVDAVKSCILATRVPQNPKGLLEEIVCDADLYHLGTDDFPLRNKMMRKETEALHHIQIDKKEWGKKTIMLMEEHHFHTEFCQELLNKKKRQNLKKLKQKDEGQVSTINPMDALVDQYIDHVRTSQEKEKNPVPEQPERGAETLFRIASGIGQRLNEQADTKAHILISVNTIIISVFIALIIRNAQVHGYVTMAVIMFLTVNLLTIVFSVLATRPTTQDGVFGQNDLENRKVNLLFFGNFYKMDFDEYSKGMFEVIGDKNFLYFTLIKNLYDQGVVLGKKYWLLKMAYNVFMIGMVVSVTAFFIASKHMHV